MFALRKSLMALSLATLSISAAAQVIANGHCPPGQIEIGFANFGTCAPGQTSPPVNVGVGNNGTITVQCVNGAFVVKFNGKFCGRCAYDWGENVGRFCIDQNGKITKVFWWNSEGHHGHGRNPQDPNNGKVHDDLGHGKCAGEMEMDCYEYDVATGKLKVVKWKRKIDATTGRETGTWVAHNTIYSGTVPSTYRQLVTLTASGNSTADGVDNAVGFAFTEFAGVAQPGSITLNLRGIDFVVSTSGGESSLKIAELFAAAVNNYPELNKQGVSAWVLPATELSTDSLCVQMILEDERTVSSKGQGGTGIVVSTPWVPGAFRVVGTGCPCSNGQIPEIVADSLPNVGYTLSIGLTGAPAYAPALLGIGNRLPGLVAPDKCQLLINPTAVVAELVGPDGCAHVPFAIPNEPVLRGFEFDTQWAVDDQGATVFTACGQVTVGM